MYWLAKSVMITLLKLKVCFVKAGWWYSGVSAEAEAGGWWILFEPISNCILGYGWLWYWYGISYFGILWYSLVWEFWGMGGMVLCNLASYYVFIPRPLTIIMRPTRPPTVLSRVRLLCASDAIKFETLLRGGRWTRDRAYWRAGELSLH